MRVKKEPIKNQTSVKKEPNIPPLSTIYLNF